MAEETGGPKGTGKPDSAAPRVMRPRWHYVYFVLAGLNIITISGTLVLSNQSNKSYDESIRLNKGWSARLGRYEELRRKAADMDRAGNEVFDSRDASGERIKLEAAVVEWDRLYSQAVLDVAQNATAADSKAILKELSEANVAVSVMAQHARQTLQAYLLGRISEATSDMAAMDRSYDTVNREVADISDCVRKIQKEHFEVQAAAAASLARSEMFVAILLIPLVASICWYGVRISRHVASSTRELERSYESLRESEGKFRTLATRAPVGIFQADASGGIVYVNDQWTSITGLGAGEYAGSGWLGAVHEDDCGRVAGEWSSSIRRGSLFSSDFRCRPVNGLVRWVYAVASPLQDGSGPATGFIGMLVDISERKRAEQMQNEFVSMASHELRTPLTSIRGSLGLVSSGVVGALPEKVKPLIDVATKNCERLATLVNDILDVDRIASGHITLTMKTISMNTFAPQVLEATRGFAGSLGIEMEFQPEVEKAMVRADEGRLSQVLTNLLSNACKFSPRGAKVTVEVTKCGNRIRLSVQDRGRGIPEEFRSRIFQKFAQADSADGSNRKGTGLGLAISKGLVELMGGTIGFESRVGVGTTFYVDFNEVRATGRSDSYPDGRPRILICEDDADNAKFLKATIEREGFDVDVACALKDAGNFLAAREYVAMTLDLGMPDGSGLSFLRKIRENSPTARLPVIVVSASITQNHESVGGQEFELVDWLAKPFPEDILRESLRRSCPIAAD